LIAGTDTGVEQVGFQEDLTVGNRDDVGRNERGNVTGLRFDHWQRGQRTGLALDFAIADFSTQASETRAARSSRREWR
jgi:hypothetical protein